MKNKTKIFIGLMFAVLASLCFGLTFRNAVFYSPSGEVPFPQLKAAEASQGEGITVSDLTPKELYIPAISVDAKVQDVGITGKGNMATPDNFTDVGWYKYGPLPGQVGSVVIAGHIDDGLAFPGVFKHLSDLKTGDDVYIQTENGEEIHYVVSSSALYAYNASADTVFNQNDGRYLKLITCAGTWVKDYGTHDERLVVTATEI